MKALITALIGLISAGALVSLLFDIKIEPKFNNIVIFGSNNTVNPTIDSRLPVPVAVPQPSVIAQTTPVPVVPPKETSSVKEDPANEKVDNTEQSSTPNAKPTVPNTKTAVAKTNYYPKTRSDLNWRNLAGGNRNNYYRDAVNRDEEDSCTCPVNSSPVSDTKDIDVSIFQNSRPTTTQYTRTEQRQELYVNGVKTVKRKVTVTSNGETKVYYYDY